MKNSTRLASTILAIMLIMVMILTACNSGQSETTAAPETTQGDQDQTTQPTDTEGNGDESKTIALIPPAMISPYYASVIQGATEVINQLGYELLTLAPESESDYAAQVQIVEDMITQQVDGIILCAINSDAIISAVRKANDANIPVVMFNTQNELPGVDVACYVRYDQYEGGAKVCDFVATYFDGKANVAIIEGLPSSHTTERKGGFEDRAAEMYPDIKVVASQPGDWEREKGMNAATNMLQANPDIDVFFALSDEMGLGAVQAIKQAGTDTKVCSFDGNPNAVTSIKAGDMLSTLSIGGVGTGAACVQALADMFNGKDVEYIINVDTEMITIDNADQFASE